MSVAAMPCALQLPPTLVVRGAAWASKAHLARVCPMPVAVDAPARHSHGPVAVAVGTRHCAVGKLMSEVSRKPTRNRRGVRGIGWVWRVCLMREGSRAVVRWWGHLLVGRVGEV